MMEPTAHHQRSSPLRHIARTLFHITLPPLAGRYHGRYRGKPHHLAFDTVLAVGMLVLLVWNVVLTLTRATTVSPLSLSITAPAEAVSGTSVEYTLTITNDGNNAGHDLTLDLTYPKGFVLTESSIPAANRDHTVWYVDTVEKNESATLSVRGTLYGDAETRVPLRAALQYRQRNRALSETAFGWVTMKPISGVTVTLSAPQNVVADQAFPATMVVQNTGDNDLSDLALVVSSLNGTTLTNSRPAFSEPDVWNIATLPKGTAQTFAVTATLSKQNAPFRFISVLAQRVGSERFDQVRDEQSITVFPPRVITEQERSVALSATVLYWSTAGIQFGFGPLPPKVGQRTSYRLFWTVTAETHALKEGTVRATLPASVTWKNNATASSGDQPHYDASQRTVIWKFRRIAAAEQISASFDVSITPVLTDIGKTMLLLNASELIAALEDGTNVFAETSGILNVLADPNTQDSGKVAP